jgi:hypothetical protein
MRLRARYIYSAEGKLLGRCDFLELGFDFSNNAAVGTLIAMATKSLAQKGAAHNLGGWRYEDYSGVFCGVH